MMRVSWLALTLALPVLASAQRSNDSPPAPLATPAQPRYAPSQPGYAPAPPAQPANAQAPYGQPANAQAPYGQPANAQSPYGQPANAQAPYGQAASAQAAYGQPANGQPSSGQAAAPGGAVAERTAPAARLTLATHSVEVAQLVTGCANAIDNRHYDVARQRCGEAIAKDDGLGFAHYLLAQVVAPIDASRELARAAETVRRASAGERLFVEGYRAQVQARTSDARKAYDLLVATLPGDARARVARGQFRQQAGEYDGAVGDFSRAVELDPRYPAAWGMLAFALADAGRAADADAALAKYAALAPNEANAADAQARMALRRGALDDAIQAAHHALQLDATFVAAEATLGDALLFAGRGREARKAYAALLATEDALLHHVGAMREARSWLFDGRGGDCERTLLTEATTAQKTQRPGDQADALVELARVQLDRGALADAGQSLRQAREAVEGDAAAAVAESERRQLSAEGLFVRAMVLGAVGEQQLANARADEMGVALKLAGDAHAGQKATALKGWVAARNGDDKAAAAELGPALRPTLKMALALAAARAGDEARARGLMEELAKRPINDMEGALTRPRAAAWLRARPAAVGQTGSAPAQ